MRNTKPERVRRHRGIHFIHFVLGLARPLDALMSIAGLQANKGKDLYIEEMKRLLPELTDEDKRQLILELRWRRRFGKK